MKVRKASVAVYTFLTIIVTAAIIIPIIFMEDRYQEETHQFIAYTRDMIPIPLVIKAEYYNVNDFKIAHTKDTAKKFVRNSYFDAEYISNALSGDLFDHLKVQGVRVLSVEIENVPDVEEDCI